MGGKRVVTAIVLIPVIYSVVRYLPPLYFLLFVAACVLIGQYEFYRFYYRAFNIFSLLGLIFGFALLLSFYAEGNSAGAKGVVLSAIVLLVLTGFLLLKANVRDALTGASVIVFGVLYMAWPFGHLISLRYLINGQRLIFFILIVTWGVDTGAYYTGRLFGRHKLSPHISPGKTVEGAVGGVVSAVGAAFFAGWLFLPELSVNHTVFMGVIFGVVSQIGDLSESMLKRSAGVKDSGHILPAHGGMLDRVDSLIYTIPVFYYYIIYFMPEITRVPV
jgi:phosphatidate cytidylyltransferase